MFLSAAIVAMQVLTSASTVLSNDAVMYVPASEQNFTERFRAAPAIRAGDFIFISGVVAYVPADVERTPEVYEAAIRDAFNQVELVLNEAGASWSDVVEMTSFHVDMREHQEIFRRVREEFITATPYPAWTGIGVETLWADALFVEMRVQAYLGSRD